MRISVSISNIFPNRELVVVLELASDSQLGVVISERLIQDNLVNMEVEWVTLNTGNHGDSVDNVRSHITDMEVGFLFYFLEIMKKSDISSILKSIGGLANSG